MTEHARRPSCFLSYAREDDEPFVERLRDELRSPPYEVDVWWDRVAMQSRGVPFVQEIDEAVRGVDRVVVVCGPRASASRYVGHELEIARRWCKVVVPVLRLGSDVDVPDWLRSHHRFNLDMDNGPFDLRADSPDQLAALCRAIARPRDPIAPIPAGLPPVPKALLANGAASQAVQLLMPGIARDERPPGDTSAVRLAGLPGIGKTVAAGLVARECAVRRSYWGGVEFVRVGPDSGGQAVVNDLRHSLGVVPDAGETAAEAVASLTEALAGTRRLIVLDDVWRFDQLRGVWAALAGGPHGLLFTTRHLTLGADLATAGLEVGLPGEAEVTAFIKTSLNDPEAELPPAATQVAERCGYLPLALALCLAQVRRGVSWDDLAAALDDADPQVLGGGLSGYEHPGATAAMRVSVDQLTATDPPLADRYRQLTLFRRGRPVPANIIERLWGAGDERDRRTARRQLAELGDRSLLIYDDATGDVVLHDLHWHFLRSQGTEVHGLAGRLLDSYGRSVESLVAAAASDGWLRKELLTLLQDAGRSADADALMALTGEDGGHLWADLRARHGELDGLWEDLHVWAGLDGTPREQVRRWTRSTVIRSSIRSSAWRVPPRLLAAAVRSGVWTVEQAMDVTRRNPAEDQRIPARLQLLEFLPPQRRALVLREALEELPKLRSGKHLVHQLRPLLRWLEADGVGIGAGLEALAETPAGALGPEVFGLLAGHLGEHRDRDRAEWIARRSRDPLAAAAALTLADPPELAWPRIVELCKEADVVRCARIVAAGARPDSQQLTDFADRLARQLCDPDWVWEALLDLLPVVSGVCLGKLVDAYGAKGGLLAGGMGAASIDVYRKLRQRDVSSGDATALWRAGQLDPSSLGTGLLARVAAAGLTEPGIGTPMTQRAAVVGQLEELLSPDADGRRDVSVLSDISEDISLVWPQLPDQLHEQLLDAAGELAGANYRAAALMPWLRQLPGPQRRTRLARELTRLSNQADPAGVAEALDALADLLEGDQVADALAVATASRDDGYEWAGFKSLVDALPPADQPRAVRWAIGRAMDRLQQEGFAHDDQLVILLETLTELGHDLPAQVDGRNLEHVVAGLRKPELRARGMAALAVSADHLWPRAEAALDEVQANNDRILVLSTWCRLATDERRSEYFARAIELLPSVDHPVIRAEAIGVLIPYGDLTAYADDLINSDFPDRWRRYLPDVAAALSPSVVTRVAERYDDELDDESAAAVTRRLLALQALTEARTLRDALRGPAREAAVRASLDDLDADQVRAELGREPGPRLRPMLLARLAALTHVQEALKEVEHLSGLEHLRALARVAPRIHGESGPRRVAAELEVLSGAGTASLSMCVRDELIPLLLRLPPDERRDACRQLLDLPSQRPRLQALEPTYAMAPLIAAVGGAEAVTDTFEALQDVMRWWPSQPRALQTSPGGGPQ